MRISKELLKKINVEEDIHSIVRLINVQTGGIDKDIIVGRTYNISYKEHGICLSISASSESSASIGTRLNIKFDKISISVLAAMFTVYKNLLTEHQDDYKEYNINDLYRQRHEREVIRAEIIKQERQYEKKLMMDEIKRLAKENVDLRRPPITAALPTPKTITEE